MAISRQRKQELVTELGDVFRRAKLMVVYCQIGLGANESWDFRSKIREAGGRVFVTKNTLAKVAMKGTSFESMQGHFKGVTNIIVAFDDSSALEVAKRFRVFMRHRDAEKYYIIAGMISGRAISPEEVRALADLPSLDVLRARLVGVIQAPAAKIARTVQEPAARVARVVAAKKS